MCPASIVKNLERVLCEVRVLTLEEERAIQKAIELIEEYFYDE